MVCAADNGARRNVSGTGPRNVSGTGPPWLGWISIAAAVAQLLLWGGTVVSGGPLALNGWLTYVLYPLFLIWLVPTTVVMIKRLGKPAAA